MDGSTESAAVSLFYHAPPGTVRQLIETSRDGGATWVVGFDAIYRRPD